MRTLCDECESAGAILFCAADEAALCRSCDEKVHMCNKLASRHVRVGITDPSDVSQCDICENEPAFFYCEIDGSSLCLQCDMMVRVGVKRTHGRYLLWRQRVEFPGDKPGCLQHLEPKPDNTNVVRGEQGHPPKLTIKRDEQSHKGSSVPILENSVNSSDEKMENKLIDLNARPQRILGQASTNQDLTMGVISDNDHEPAGVVPVGSFKWEPEK